MRAEVFWGEIFRMSCKENNLAAETARSQELVVEKKKRESFSVCLSLSFSRTTVGIRLRLAARTPLCHVTIDNNPPMSECVARLCRKRLCRKVSRLLATVATLVFFECFLFFIETGLLIFFLCFYLTRVGHLV